MRTNGKPLRILVTGGAGFIGSHVADAYLREGHQVTTLDDLSSGKKQNLNPRARFVRMDIRNQERVRWLFKKGRFDVVNHHAAQVDVRRSVADPATDAQINILGLLNILEGCRQQKVKKIIFSSSGGTIYGECKANRPPNEEAPARPLSPYGIAKLASEFYIKAYAALHGLDHCILRYANVYGPRQDPLGEAGVVAIFARRMLEKQPVWIFGDGRQSRDFVYAGDVANANLLALSATAKNIVLNIGTGCLTNVNQLFAAMAKHLSYDRKAIHKPARTGELKTSLLDISAAKRILGWKPSLVLETGLLKTIDFFRTKEPTDPRR